MGEVLSPLELELAAYSPLELAELSDTIRVLLDSASEGTAGFLAARARIDSALNHAIARRLEAERRASRGATIIPFRVR
ncbi:MAG: hypothetical protein ABIT04_00550 [Novosphingobium sp.]